MHLRAKIFGTGEVLTNTNEHILVVEDESEIRDLIALHLLRQGYKVTECSTAEEANAKIVQGQFSMAIFDWMLPGMNGVDLVKIARHIHPDMPILMVTAKSEPQDIVEGLDGGADDFLSKPFVPNVLVARVKALLRRSKVLVQKPPQEIDLLGLHINFENYETTYKGESLHFTPSEFKLLSTLIQNRGSVLTRERLIEHIQGEGISVIGRTIDTHVFGLRKKLGEWGDNIETIRGVGYRVRVED